MGSEADLNRLTREEWNAAYFLGLERVVRHGRPYSLAEQLADGVDLLVRAGYRPAGPSPAGRVAHEQSCREIADGRFDLVGRAGDALAWLVDRVPRADTRWLEALLSLHPSPSAGGGPARQRRSPCS